MARNLAALLKTLQRKKVLVVGDLILDVHHYGVARKASVEKSSAAVEEQTTMELGGAGLLVRNIVGLGGRVVFVSVVADDRFKKKFDTFKHKNFKKHFLVDEQRKTNTVKERFWIVEGKAALKWNHLDDRHLRPALEKKILHHAEKDLPSADKLIISDYRHGMISQNLARKLLALARRLKKPVYVDSQISQSKGNHVWYKNADLICLNLSEARYVFPRFTQTSAERSLKNIARKLGVKNIVVKLGAKGSCAWIEGKFIRTPAAVVRAVSPLGAGDAFFSVLCLAPHPVPGDFLTLANLWAGLSTTLAGTELPTLPQFKKAFVSRS